MREQGENKADIAGAFLFRYLLYLSCLSYLCEYNVSTGSTTPQLRCIFAHVQAREVPLSVSLHLNRQTDRLIVLAQQVALSSAAHPHVRFLSLSL